MTAADGTPVVGLDVRRVASNGTSLSGVTDDAGTWTFQDFFGGTVTVLAAGPGWRGAALTVNPEEWTQAQHVRMETEKAGGSVLFDDGSGYIPGLGGRLNPIRDTFGRTYIYGDNLSFDEAPEQPFHTAPGAPFTVSDNVGNMFRAEVVVILGRTSLMTYSQLESSPLTATG